MVDEGLLTVPWANEIFMWGFDFFAVGKFLVVPATLLLGVRRSILLQLAAMAATRASYLVAPASTAVQLGASPAAQPTNPNRNFARRRRSPRSVSCPSLTW